MMVQITKKNNLWYVTKTTRFEGDFMVNFNVTIMHTSKDDKVYKYLLSKIDHRQLRFRKYVKFEYDDQGQVKKFLFISKVPNKDYGVILLEFENGELIKYKDTDGNEWYKSWGTRCIFKFINHHIDVMREIECRKDLYNVVEGNIKPTIIKW